MNNSIELTRIGRYETGIFDEGAAEITAYDAGNQNLYVINGANQTIDILDLSDPTNPTFISSINIEEFGDGINSIAIQNGIVAAAIESDPAQDPGKIVFFDTDGNVLNQVTVGALPDMVTFTPDGTKVLVANEGEPNEDNPENNPEGSVSIINLADGVENATVTTADFTKFNGQEAELRGRGVRIFPEQTFTNDAEPEYIAVSPDSTQAFVTLQENNAIAVVDLEAGEIREIQPLGLKDYSRGLPQLTNYPWDLSGEVLGTTPAGQEILLGGLSGLFYEGETNDGKLQFIATPDRGPNGEPTDVDGDGEVERPFPLPDYQAKLVRFTLDRESGEFEITEEIPLTREDGQTPITGLPNLQAGAPGTAYTDELPVDLNGNPLENDPFGADMESIVVADDGSFFLSDEYRPAIYHFDPQGVLIDRFIPEGTAESVGHPEGAFGTETLPAVYAQRRANRGFEGMALNTDNGNLYAFIQSPIDNPDVSNPTAKSLDESSDFNSRNSQVLRILEVDPTTGEPVGEYVYFLEGSPGVDKIGDAVYAGDGKFYVIERDSGTDADAEKFIFEVDLTGATNILGTELSTGGRSFSIRDANGNIVFDSGDDFAQITAQQVSQLFNSNGTVDSFDSRSDAKGAEPEGVVVGEIDGKIYAFVGLERTGGIMVYDISEPAESAFVQYINPIEEETGDALDLAPEGLQFISAEDSPNGTPLLTVSNEVSGTVSVYQIDLANTDGGNDVNGDNNDGGENGDAGNNGDGTFTLQLLHAADQEAGIPALDDADNFSAVLNALRDEDADGDGVVDYENTLTLSSGDAYIPGPFLAASDEAFGGQGRGDILIQNALGFEAIALGNHEFDLGTGTLADLISADEDDDYPGTAFPYLSSNLDFSTDEDLAPLVVEDGQEAREIPHSIAGNTIITVNGEQIGVVGSTTPTLPSISSSGDVTVKPIEFDSNDPEDIAALAAEIQSSVDSLLADNPDLNKVVLLSHMQQISIEEALSVELTDVDIIVAGGSNTLLADDTDRLRAGEEAQGDYPIINTAADGNPVAIVNTDGNYKYVGRLVVDFDENGVIIPDSINPEISGAYATDEEGVSAVNGTPDPEVVEVTDALSEVIAEQDGNIFGSSEVFLNGIREDVRTQETNLGNLSADANLAIARETDSEVVISIKNGGGIRDSIGTVVAPPGSTDAEDVERLTTQANELAGKEEGDISQLDISNSLRFNNGLSLLTVTAEELLEIIEHGVSATEEGGTPGQFPQVAGIEFSFDPDLEPGDRVQSLAIKDDEGNIVDTVVEDGELVGESDRTFRLVTLGFLADGGDDYPFPDRDRVDLALEEEDPRTGEANFAPDGTEQDALAEYLFDNFSETSFDNEDVSPELDTRIQNLAFRDDTVLSAEDMNGDSGDGSDGISSNGDDGNDGGNTDTGFEPQFGTLDADEIEIIGSNGLVFAGDGDDLIDATVGSNNRIYAGSGKDIIIIGESNRIFGETGDDSIFVTSGGDNLITGGEGADQFWIASAAIPESTNMVDDFTAGEDVIGIAGFGIGFDEVSLVQQDDNTLISTGDDELVTLMGINVDNLSADNFAFA